MNSAFRILANDEPNNRNLVIVVNKNGQVSTDTEALQTLLTSKGSSNTGISILRETSPTPSISDEIEQERSEKIEFKRQEYLKAHDGEEIDEEELENQIRQITGSIEDDIPHVSLTVENFYSPDQARKFANDVLHLGGIENPQSLMPIDFNFQRQIIQNDHCYTSLTQSPVNHQEKSQTAGKSSQKVTKREPKPSAKVRQHQIDDDSSDSAGLEEDEDEYGEEQSGEEEEEISFSESDDDNDMDFSVNDRFGKKGKKKRKYRKHKQKNMTFKDFLETGEVQQIDDEPKKKYNKSPLKKVKPSTSGKIKNTQIKLVKNVTVAKTSTPIVSSPLVIANSTPTTSQFVPLGSFMKSQQQQVPSQISVQSSHSTIPQPKSKQEIEFVESIVKDLEKSFPESGSNDKNIPNIMQMMETNTPAEMIDQSLSSLEQLDSGDGAVPGIEEIGDALIAALGNDAIDELLNHDELINFAPIHQQQLQSAPSSTVMSEPSPSPKILNKQAPMKDPIKVVRNGRVITLPPIEAPTTRGAKRRAQGDSPNAGKVAKTDKVQDSDSKSSSRRSSLNKSESGKSSRRQSVVQAADELDDLISDASWASEDDPDRLWCICKQPHNNRFMICCDKCEDWFHGKCVNVTKAMGKEIELMGKEWRCPNCKAGVESSSTGTGSKKKALNQQKLTKFFAKSQMESTDEDVAKTMCVVCNSKAARESSIYCSDECIQNHATKHLDSDKEVKPPTKVDKAKRGNVLKDKNGNVIVYEKTTGKILPLNKSPHFTQLGQWLAQNPNFEPVKPGTSQAEQILSKNRTPSQTQVQSQPQTPTSTTITTPQQAAKQPQTSSGEDLFSNPIKINTGATPTVVMKKVPATQGQHSANSVSQRSNVSVKNTSNVTVKATVKTLPNVKSPSVTSSTPSKTPPSKPAVKRQFSEESSASSSSMKVKIEQERSSVRNILRDTLKQRMVEFEHPNIPKMNEEEITGFAKEVEREMFLFYNKDTRDKYKTKYRSLKFNLGDVKNKTLLEKICAKKLTPKQLVELPPAALASEELSKWREDENKHQLEIITKSELDALAQTKIVVKTHKGEEIIETKTVKTDILVPVIDDVESVIAKTVLSVDDPHGRYDLSRSISLNISGGNVNVSSPLSSPSISSSTGRKSETHHRSRSKSRDRHHHHHHKSSSSSASKHKKSDRHRSRSPKHHKSMEKSRERSKSKKSDSSHHRDKSKDKIKNNKQKLDSKPEAIQPDQQDVDLVGKILDSMGVHLEKPKDDAQVVATSVAIESAALSTEPINEHKLEIEIYSGNMHMADVADFNVTASIVSGNFDDILKLLPQQLEAIGRIEPHQVWDYLEKVKKLPGKEICILRFASNDESAYFQFFSYLHTRQRYGVIKSPSPKIKDFYLVPVESSRPLPKVLLPVTGPGFIEGDEHKPDLLLGVILKVLPEIRVKKPIATQKKQASKPSRPPVVIEHPIHVEQTKHKSSKLTMGLPEFSKLGELKSATSKSPLTLTDDGDEPYTPFDDDEYIDAPVFTAESTPSTLKASCGEDLESQMEKINKEIEKHQMEIQSLKSMELDEDEARRIYENINVPHNLSEILSSITGHQTNPSKAIEIDDEDDDEYVPIPYHNSGASTSYSALSAQAPIVNSMMDIDERVALFQGVPPVIVNLSTNQPSRLASMSEADLMKLVPDGALEAPPAPKISRPSIPGLDDEEDFEMN